MEKPKLRISATDLDNFRWFKILENKTTEEYIQELLAPFRTNYKMQFGQAINAVIQHDKSIRKTDKGAMWINKYHKKDNPDSVDKIWLPSYLINAPLSYFSDCYHEIAWEVKHLKKIHFLGYDIDLVAKVDGLHGNIIHELKTTEQFKLDSYTESMQKLLYLYVYEADTIIYTVFEYRELQAGNLLKKLQDSDFSPIGIPELRACPSPDQIVIDGKLRHSSESIRFLNSINQFEQYSYQVIEQKIFEILGEFIDFIFTHNIQSKYISKK